MSETVKVNQNKQALTYAIILSIVVLIINTIQNMFLINSFFGFYGSKILGYVIFVVLMGVFAVQFRKANGGFIEFKEVFKYLFIMILITELVYFVYTFIYFKYIDPQFLEKMKQATLNYMEKANVPSEQLDKTSDSFDQQIKEAAKGIQIGKTLLNYFWFVILDSLFALIVSAIVKRKRPMFDE
ncbi:MAG: DUF4199 domain-containing protein [Bacteroidetes bacterium]|nr:DUF4199 domain-containing protein [Bacteroidota bacterium]